MVHTNFSCRPRPAPFPANAVSFDLSGSQAPRPCLGEVDVDFSARRARSLVQTGAMATSLVTTGLPPSVPR